jgi:hypothetical protein
MRGLTDQERRELLDDVRESTDDEWEVCEQLVARGLMTETVDETTYALWTRRRTNDLGRLALRLDAIARGIGVAA